MRAYRRRKELAAQRPVVTSQKRRSGLQVPVRRVLRALGALADPDGTVETTTRELERAVVSAMSARQRDSYQQRHERTAA